MFLNGIKRIIAPDVNVVLAVYISCALLFFAVLLVSGPSNFARSFLHPLDDSYSVLGTKSAFKKYIDGPRVYAFLPFWSLGKDMNVKNVTDLAYFGLNVDSKGRIVKTDGPYEKWRKSRELSGVLKELKQQSGRVALTLICHNDKDIDAILGCKECWKDLYSDLKSELDWAGIRDVNLDFEYSGYTTGENALLYSELAAYLNNKLDEAYGDSFLVVSAYADSADRAERMQANSVAGSNAETVLEKDLEDTATVRLTDPQSLTSAVDAIFIMAYDFHRPNSSNAGPVSPFEGSYTTTRLNLVKALDTYLKVVTPDKLILGLPFYGYDWIVEDTSPMSTRVEGNESIGFSKSRTYAEVVDMLIDRQIKPLWEEISKTFYFNYIDEESGSNRQVWYDDAESLRAKFGLVKDKGLLGVGVWALGFEGGYDGIWKFLGPN